MALVHRRVVGEFIEAVLGELVLGVDRVERSLLGVAFRREVDTWLAPDLLAVHALLLLLTRLPEWLENTSVPLPSGAGFLNEVGWNLDPVAY